MRVTFESVHTNSLEKTKKIFEKNQYTSIERYLKCSPGTVVYLTRSKHLIRQKKDHDQRNMVHDKIASPTPYYISIMSFHKLFIFFYAGAAVGLQGVYIMI